MSKPLSRRLRLLSAFALASVCFLGFGFFEAPAPVDEDLYVFAMSVQDDDGQLLGSPVVVGQADGKVEVHLMCEVDPSVEKLSLTLEPEPAAVGREDGKLRYSYVLSVPGRLEREVGTVVLAPGREQQITLESDEAGRRVTFALYAAPIQAPGVERYLKARRVKLGRTAS